MHEHANRQTDKLKDLENDSDSIDVIKDGSVLKPSGCCI